MLEITLDQEEEYLDGEIRKIVIDKIFQPLRITYKYRAHGDGVDIPTEGIKWCNSENGSEVPLFNSFNFQDIRKACYADAKMKLNNEASQVRP